MIRITKPGKVLAFIITGKCLRCGCELECAKSDIIYPDQPCVEGYVPCPTCGEAVQPIEKLKGPVT